MNTDLGSVNPWYYPVTSSSPYPFHNQNFNHLPEYTPPPTPSYVFHSPQPPPYYTPLTPYPSSYLSDNSGVPWYSTYQQEIQAHPNPYPPPLSYFMSSSDTTTQFSFGFTNEQQPEVVVSQVFDESPESLTMSITEASEDKCSQMDDKFTQMIQTLEKMRKNLEDSSRIVKGISSRLVSPSSRMLTHDPFPDNKSIVDKPLDDESDDSNDLQLPEVDIFDPHMFDGSPEREFVHENGSDSTFEDGEDENETPRAIVDSSVGKLDSKGRNESDGGMVAANGVFVIVDDVGFENENEKSAEEIKDDMFNSSKDESNRPLNNDIMLKDIEEWRPSKSEISLALGSVNVANALDVGDGTKEKNSEIGTLKEEVKDGDLNGNGEENAFEESENVEDQSCEEHYMVSKIYRSNDMSTIVNEGKLFNFDPGGYKRNVTCLVSRLKEINRCTEVGPDGIAIVISVCSVSDIREDMGAEAKKWREGFESKKGVEGVSAEHGSGTKITNDCSHFSTQIGDLKSIKKIYDEMCGTYNGEKNARISVMVKQRYVGKKIVPEKICFESNNIILLSILNVGGYGCLIYELKVVSKFCQILHILVARLRDMELLVHFDFGFALHMFGEDNIDLNEIQLILGPLLDKNLKFCLRTSVPNLGEEMTVVALKACQHLVATFRRCMDTTKPGDNVCYTSLMAAGYRYKFDAMWEKENESICDDDKFVALLLSDKIDADRKHYDENLQLMVQMMLGASNLSTQWDNTMQLKGSHGLKTVMK
ncbi:hypothetical protein POM88_049933 [Heracleum sosnowskyi]|uniref:Uncharacterized protein n=1 Tax=Heracleum sosnowskyi TaxID=360622 RepID=A0AAD8GWM7_9APIA|nr:hypothetical protein POM88_049933 [Heracleum sosnowskyi]